MYVCIYSLNLSICLALSLFHIEIKQYVKHENMFKNKLLLK